VEELLHAGLAGVVAMQARLPAETAVMFLKRFLARALDGQTLPRTFTFARQTCADPSSPVWSVPVLFTRRGAPDIDLGLGSRRLWVRSKLREFAFAFVACPKYVTRGNEASLSSVFSKERGVALLQTERGAGSTVFVSHVARGVLDPGPGETDGWKDTAGAPRPLLYLDAEQLPGPSITDLVEEFSERYKSSLGAFLQSGAFAPDRNGQSLKNEDELLAWLRSTDSVLVIDHADRLGTAMPALIRRAQMRLDRGLLFLVIPVGEAIPEGIPIVGLARFGRNDCVSYAKKFGEDESVGADWFSQTGGEVHLLSWLAHRQARPSGSTTGLSGTLQPAELANSLVAEFSGVALNAVALAEICSCFPAGVRTEWLSTLAPHEAPQLETALRLGLLLTQERDLLRFVVVPRLYREPLSRRAAGWASADIRPLDAAASRALAYLRRVMPLGEVAPTVYSDARRLPGVVELLTDLATLMPGTSLEPQVRVDFVRWVCQLNRSLGRHAANRTILERHLARVPLSRWESSDLLLYGLTAQALGLTELHGEILAILVQAGLEPGADRPDVRIAYLLQSASHLKDAAVHERLAEIRELYNEATELVERVKRAAGSPADVVGAEKLRATTVLNRAVLERYWARDLSAAEEGFSDAARLFQAVGDVVLSARAEVEAIGSAVGIRGRDLSSTLARLDELIALLDREGAADARAFACLQKARVLRELSPTKPAEVGAAYAGAAEAARLAGTPAVRAAALRHQAEWQRRAGTDDQQLRPLLESAVALAADCEGNAWAQRVRRDALTELARIEPPGTARTERWRHAVQAALTAPLRAAEPGSDRSRLADILREAVTHLPLHDPVNADTLRTAGLDPKSGVSLAAQVEQIARSAEE
jgi:hypothetical protein